MTRASASRSCRSLASVVSLLGFEGLLGLAEAEHNVARGEEDVEALRAAEEPNAGIELSDVGLEPQALHAKRALLLR